MQTNRQYIESLCQDIQRKGGTPTVGLLRSRSTRKLSVKEVIEVLKQWKSQPTTQAIEQSDDPQVEATSKVTLESRVSELEKQVIELKKQLDDLSGNDRR